MMEFLAEAESQAVRERRFNLRRGGRLVPGVLWTPAGASGSRPLVLLGHGGSGHKRQDYVTAMARRLVRHHGFAAAAIDGPTHGDRSGAASDPFTSFLNFAQAWSSDEAMTDEMVADYVATLDALQSLREVGEEPVGWWGLSMGTILGLPFVAAEKRVSAAFLGAMGLTGPTKERIRSDAPSVTCPVLFLVLWDDKMFPRDTAFALFDELGSKDKRLHAVPGGHGEVPEEEFACSEGFLATHLGTSRPE
jgi:dienelactone hydrolase